MEIVSYKIELVEIICSICGIYGGGLLYEKLEAVNYILNCRFKKVILKILCTKYYVQLLNTSVILNKGK